MKINYEITVDVRGMSVENKVKVQVAYFKLGYGWKSSGKKLQWLDGSGHRVYTNKHFFSGVVCYLTAWYRLEGVLDDDQYRPTHTFKQLMELAYMGDPIPTLQDLNSDELRDHLTNNTNKVNKLIRQNDEIVEVLRSRGFVSVEINQVDYLKENSN